MILIKANLWDVQADLYGITTNGVVKADGRLVMGKGVALQAAQRYPGIEVELGKSVARMGNRLQMVFDNHLHPLCANLFSFPTKQDWRSKSDLELIEVSAQQ